MFVFLGVDNANKKIYESSYGKKWSQIYDSSDSRDFADVMYDLIQLLRVSNLLSEHQLNQYTIVEEESSLYSGVHISSAFQLLFDTFHLYTLSIVASDILVHKFGEIVRVLLSKYNCTDNWIVFEVDELLRVLSGFVLRYIRQEQIVVFSIDEEACFCESLYHAEESDEEDETENNNQDEDQDEDDYIADNELVQCIIITLDNDNFERYASQKDEIHIPQSLFNNEDIVMEDMVTFVNRTTKKAITFQIIGCGFPEKDEFDKLMKTMKSNEVDNNSYKSESDEIVFDFTYSFKALRLGYPILNCEDIIQYKTG